METVWGLLKSWGPPAVGAAVAGLFQLLNNRRKRLDELEDAQKQQERDKLSRAQEAADHATAEHMLGLISAAHQRADEAVRMSNDLRRDAFAGMETLGRDLRSETTEGHHRVRRDMQSAVVDTNTRISEVEARVAVLDELTRGRK